VIPYPKRAPNLPRIAPAAWHGTIGDAMREIAPTTEGDPAAILAQTLALFGALVGDGPHVRIGKVNHPPQIWPLIVGKTGSGRKGTGLAAARSFVYEWSPYAAGYLRHRVHSGLSSGEGLLEALGAAKTAPGKQGEERVEPIAPDGKLTIVETEFTRVLGASKREGNTLGPVLRQLWDEGRAGVMTRAAPLAVSEAHLTLISHVTPRELKLRLAEGDVVGGTVNRFLMIASERPHLLPDEMTEPDVAVPAKWLGEVVEQARFAPRLMHRDRDANALWREVYAALSDDEPDGPLGAVLARGPAYTMRLALVYALADGAGAIAPQHLLAGLAVWDYSCQTARAIFADTRRLNEHQRLAEYLAAAAGGRTSTEVYELFGKNKSAAELRQLVEDLERRGDVSVETQNGTGGRPVTRVWWTGAPRNAVSELLERYETHVNT
jgi:hypothetical protein